MRKFEFDRERFYKNILEYIDKMKISVVEFASICVVAPTTIYRLKWSQFAPSMDSFLKICEVLQKEPKDYFI